MLMTNILIAIFNMILAIIGIYTFSLNKKITTHQIEPEIRVQFLQRSIEDPNIITLSVKNIGNGTAKNVDIKDRKNKRFYRHKNDKKYSRLSDIGFIGNGIKMLSSGEERTAFIFYCGGRKLEELEKIVFDLEIKYENKEGKLITDEAILSIMEFENVTQAQISNTPIKKISKTLNDINATLKGRVILSQNSIHLLDDTKLGSENRNYLPGQVVDDKNESEDELN
jgi:hypothetical protein